MVSICFFENKTSLICSFLMFKVMMKKILTLVFLGSVLLSCNTTKSKKSDAVSKLEGTWELNYITGPRITFDGLFPNKKPTIIFNTKDNQVSGNNSCNTYT